MAISLVNEYAADGKKTGSVTVSSVTVSGLNRAMYVLLSCVQKNADAGAYATGVVWEATGGDESLTLLGEAQNSKATCQVWRLVNPTVDTAKNVVITFSSSSANWEMYAIGVEVLAGVDQTTPDDTWEAPDFADSGFPAHLVATSSGDWIYDICAVDDRDSDKSLSENGDGALVWVVDAARGDAASSFFEADDSQASMAYTIGGGPENWILGAISINPLAAAGAPDEEMAWWARPENPMLKKNEVVSY